ncbi:MAG: hypothetical protein EON58_09980 [Alphaproteobacteria bacterium]|nr:MAG: hypothetical protein EON58_09980 [Alphaproteobacteria bacterium]
MVAFLAKIGAAMRVMPTLSETDHGIIEAMIEIGAEVNEIAETFGYPLNLIEQVKATQPMSPFRVHL